MKTRSRRSSSIASRPSSRAIWNPALLTRMSRPPSPSTVSSTARSHASRSRRSASIATLLRPADVDQIDRRLGVLLLLGHERERDVGALAGERQRDGPADAGVATGDRAPSCPRDGRGPRRSPRRGRAAAASRPSGRAAPAAAAGKAWSFMTRSRPRRVPAPPACRPPRVRTSARRRARARDPAALRARLVTVGGSSVGSSGALVMTAPCSDVSSAVLDQFQRHIVSVSQPKRSHRTSEHRDRQGSEADRPRRHPAAHIRVGGALGQSSTTSPPRRARPRCRDHLADVLLVSRSCSYVSTGAAAMHALRMRTHEVGATMSHGRKGTNPLVVRDRTGRARVRRGCDHPPGGALHRIWAGSLGVYLGLTVRRPERLGRTRTRVHAGPGAVRVTELAAP